MNRDRLLIACQPLQVLPPLATAIGLNEALFLQQLHYWMLKSKNERDGRFWVYNTYEQWHEQFPFWSTHTITRIVQSLREKNLVLTTTQYNAWAADHTLWYTIDYKALDTLAPGNIPSGPECQPDRSTTEFKYAAPDDRKAFLDIANLASPDKANLAGAITRDYSENGIPSSSLPVASLPTEKKRAATDGAIPDDPEAVRRFEEGKAKRLAREARDFDAFVRSR
jgi:hypothetical protein